MVCVGDDDQLDVIDTETLEIVRRMGTGPDPELLDIDHKGERVYVANEDDGYVTVLERVSGKVLAEIEVGVEPEGMSVSPDDKIVAATSEATSMAHIIDAGTFKVLANILVDTRPRVATFTKDGKHVWVSAEIGGTVAVIDAATYKITKKLQLRDSGRARRAHPADGHHLFQGRQAGVRRHRSRQPYRGHRYGDLRDDELSSSPDSVRGTWRCRRTAPSSTRPTASPTT